MPITVREKINKNPVPILVGAIAAVVLAVVFSVYALRPPTAPLVPSGVYFSSDDGASFFVDDPMKIPPFMQDGKTVYGATVAECGGVKRVLFLTRYTPLAKQVLAATSELATGPKPPMPPNAPLSNPDDWGLEVKRPGQPPDAWINSSNPKFQKVISLICPDGGQAVVVVP